MTQAVPPPTESVLRSSEMSNEGHEAEQQSELDQTRSHPSNNGANLGNAIARSDTLPEGGGAENDATVPEAVSQPTGSDTGHEAISSSTKMALAPLGTFRLVYCILVITKKTLVATLDKHTSWILSRIISTTTTSAVLHVSQILVLCAL